MPLLSPNIPVSGKSVAFWITSYNPYTVNALIDAATKPGQARMNPLLYGASDYAQVKPGYASIQPKEGKGREGKGKKPAVL